MAQTGHAVQAHRMVEVMAWMRRAAFVRRSLSLCLVSLAALLVPGCREWRPDPDAWTWVTNARSPSGGSFTMEHYNELGASRGMPDGVYEGNDIPQEVRAVVPLTGGPDPYLQEVRGTYSGGYLEVSFGTRTFEPGGTLQEGSPLRLGVLSGSLESTSGPLPEVRPCSVRYGPSEGGETGYRLEFRMTQDIERMCR